VKEQIGHLKKYRYISVFSPADSIVSIIFEDESLTFDLTVDQARSLSGRLTFWADVQESKK
jgi:hypothetical protein